MKVIFLIFFFVTVGLCMSTLAAKTKTESEPPDEEITRAIKDIMSIMKDKKVDASDTPSILDLLKILGPYVLVVAVSAWQRLQVNALHKLIKSN